jgi:antitoxin CptB
MAETRPRKADSTNVPLYIAPPTGFPMLDLNNRDLDTRRRRARFRSWHRGMREVDLILGSFADARMAGLNAAELDEYEALLDIPDGDFLKWVTGEKPVPDDYDTPLFRSIRSLTEQA